MKNIVELFYDYQDNTLIFILAIVSVIYLLSKAGKKTSDYVYIAVMVLIAFVYNDLLAIPIKALIGENAYNSMIYGIPVTIICAIAMAYYVFADNSASWKKPVFIMGMVIVGLVLFRKDVVPNSLNTTTGSVRAACKEMSEVITEDVKGRREKICNDAYLDSEYISIAADTEVYGYFRYLDNRYVMAYDITEVNGEDKKHTAEAQISSMVSEGVQGEQFLIRELLSTNCVEYAVIRTEWNMNEYMGIMEYVNLGEYGEYTLYAKDTECYPMRIYYWGYVRRLYFYLLGRRGTYEEIYSQIQKIDSQEQTLDEIAYNLLESEEFRNRNMDVDEAIEAVYQAIFYRDAADGERYYWKEYIGNGGNYRDMYHELYYNSDEFKIEWE